MIATFNISHIPLALKDVLVAFIGFDLIFPTLSFVFYNYKSIKPENPFRLSFLAFYREVQKNEGTIEIRIFSMNLGNTKCD